MPIGIDYSMTCPAACAFTPGHVEFWYAHATKAKRPIDSIDGVTLGEFPSVSSRAGWLAQQCVRWIEAHDATRDIYIEDYAFAATGRVFHIGENTGIFKHYCDQSAIAYHPIPPTVIKKFATGKGNADKVRMTDAFLAAHPIAQTWLTILFPRLTETQAIAKSPLSDLADAYWIARYAYDQLIQNGANALARS
jgi:Holliday junction resolvasome RuvABC endonuclease subunit